MAKIKDLTKAERSHFRQWMGGTKAGATSTREAQKDIAKIREKAGLPGEPCYECRDLAVKLGLEPKPGANP